LAKAGVSHRLIELGKLDERLAELAKLSSSHAALWQQAEEEKEDRINIGSKAEAEDDDGEASKQYDEGTPPSRFVSVSHRPNAMDENEVDLFGVAKLGLPFDKANRNDECEWGKDTHVGKELERVDFEPTSWSYFASYSGVVKIFDGKGSNVRPEREDEQYARRIGEGLLRSIPELKKERQ
jgi:hypothetical protein